MFCPKCGGKNDDDSGFCAQCGTGLFHNQTISENKGNKGKKSAGPIIASIGAVIIIIIVIALFGLRGGDRKGGKNDLSRSEAKSAIAKSYPKPITDSIPTWIGENGVSETWANDKVNGFMGRNGNLQNSGYLQANCSNNKTVDSRGSTWYEVRCKADLADKIKPFFVKFTDDDKSFLNNAVVRVGEEVFDEITGITVDESGLGSSSRQAEYTTRIKLNEVGKLLNIEEKRSNHSATFQLYDDGWRPEKD